MKGYRGAIVAILGMAVLTAPCVMAQTRGLGSINGTITSESGEPINGAVVKLQAGTTELEGKSDASGKWVVAGLGKGEFQAEFSKDGFVTKRVRLVLEKETMRSEPIKIALKKGA